MCLFVCLFVCLLVHVQATHTHVSHHYITANHTLLSSYEYCNTCRYSSLVGTISKKFAKKRKSDGQCNTSQDGDGNASAKKTKKKRKKQFMKPSDD